MANFSEYLNFTITEKYLNINFGKFFVNWHSVRQSKCNTRVRALAFLSINSPPILRLRPPSPCSQSFRSLLQSQKNTHLSS